MANASNAALVQFPQNTGAGQTVTHFGIGFAAAGAIDCEWDLGDMNLKTKKLPGHPCFKKTWLHN